MKRERFVDLHGERWPVETEPQVEQVRQAMGDLGLLSVPVWVGPVGSDAGLLTERLLYARIEDPVPRHTLATRTTRTGEHYGHRAPIYTVPVGTVWVPGDVLQIGEGRFAYVADAAGVWSLWARACAADIEGGIHEVREAPASLEGLGAEAPCRTRTTFDRLLGFLE